MARWREDAQSRPARGRAWTAGARFEAVITTAAMSVVDKSAWCQEHGVYPVELDKWRLSCTTALADPKDARASPQATRADRKRIKELERDLLRKDRALARDSGPAGVVKKSRWDMAYLPANVMGRWFHLYLILDLYSRKIVGAEVHDCDDADHAVHLVRGTALAENIAMSQPKPVLHGDNGSTP
jgi:transposase